MRPRGASNGTGRAVPVLLLGRGIMTRHSTQSMDRRAQMSESVPQVARRVTIEQCYVHADYCITQTCTYPRFLRGRERLVTRGYKMTR